MDPIPETDTCEEEHKTLDIRSRGWGRTGQGTAEQGRAGQGRAGQGRAEGFLWVMKILHEHHLYVQAAAEVVQIYPDGFVHFGFPEHALPSAVRVCLHGADVVRRDSQPRVCAGAPRGVGRHEGVERGVERGVRRTRARKPSHTRRKHDTTHQHTHPHINIHTPTYSPTIHRLTDHRHTHTQTHALLFPRRRTERGGGAAGRREASAGGSGAVRCCSRFGPAVLLECVI